MNNEHLSSYIARQIIESAINLFIILTLVGFVVGYGVVVFRDSWIKETQSVVNPQVPQMARVVHSTK